MDCKLFLSAITKFSAGVILVGALIFLPAGTIHYPGGLLLMTILFVPMFLAGLVMMSKSPSLLRSRLEARESRSEQSLVIKLSGLMFLVGFLLAGLSYRLELLLFPGWVSILGAVLFLTSYALYAEVLRENVWLSRTIQVQEGQQVVSTGLYGIVRHPMYAVTVLLFLSMPLVLGSLLSFLVFLFYPLLISRRILDEEQLLHTELAGYDDYCRKVRWRLIPYIW